MTAFRVRPDIHYGFSKLEPLGSFAQYHTNPGVVMSETETTATEPEVTEQSADIGEQAAAAVKGDDPTTAAEATAEAVSE